MTMRLADSQKSNRAYAVVTEDIRRMRFQLEALGLIKAETVGEFLVWKITEKGRRYMLELKARPTNLPLTPEPDSD